MPQIGGPTVWTTHTYLDGISPFKYQGLWALETLHSTATMSSERVLGLYGLRLMHRRNIFLSRIGHSAERAFLPSIHCANPNPIGCILRRCLARDSGAVLAAENLSFYHMVHISGHPKLSGYV